MTRPNLFIVGAPKCGTTAWCHYLESHSQIVFCQKAKEPHYFSTDFPGFCWAKNRNAYLELFNDLPSTTTYVGEASVMYLYSSEAAKNIASFNPDAKIVIFIREPKSFLLSYHAQLLLNHDEGEANPNKSWNLQNFRDNGDHLPSTCREPAFLQYRRVASFGDQIEAYLRHFDAEQVKVIVYEEWISNAMATYSDILHFLGLPLEGVPTFERINARRGERSRVLGRLVNRPPSSLLAASRVIKNCLGIRRLGVGGYLRKANWTDREAATSWLGETAHEIDKTLSRDREKIEQLLGRKLNWNSSCPLGK